MAPIKLNLWSLKCKIHIIFTFHEKLLHQPHKHVKAIPSLPCAKSGSGPDLDPTLDDSTFPLYSKYRDISEPEGAFEAIKSSHPVCHRRKEGPQKAKGRTHTYAVGR